jgi:hypothetical protein
MRRRSNDAQGPALSSLATQEGDARDSGPQEPLYPGWAGEIQYQAAQDRLIMLNETT